MVTTSADSAKLESKTLQASGEYELLIPLFSFQICMLNVNMSSKIYTQNTKLKNKNNVKKVSLIIVSKVNNVIFVFYLF